MLRNPPEYFESVRGAATTNWDDLERQPDLAAPWRQLFRQVQSPRHVLSELLQNADDAGATEATVRIDDGGLFIFEHNGEDFTEPQFRSLCRFGFSNKRSLFTIGFRGIGFKSTFSLGDTVEVLSPTLSVEFHSNRFTQPHWTDRDIPESGRTRVSVQISDAHRRVDLERNFAEWIRSPLSLLFFRSLRCLSIGERTLRFTRIGDGPIPGSERVRLHGMQTSDYLLIRSEPEPFPREALEEINKERLDYAEGGLEFPPCSLDIVLGGTGQFYAVLPTGGVTGLPFSCNAPFMLTPDREHIKSPSLSPVNRWLLERLGRIAADSMIGWLANHNLSEQERAAAYDLLPGLGTTPSTVDEQHAQLVDQAFLRTVTGRPLLLTHDGTLTAAQKAVRVPEIALKIWDPEQASILCDPDARPVLCPYVTQSNADKLKRRQFLTEVAARDLIARLAKISPPRPQSLDRISVLWSFAYDQTLNQRPERTQPSCLFIVPVEGSPFLHQAAAVVRIPSRPVQCRSQSDWEFLIQRLKPLDAAWIRHACGSVGSGPGEPSNQGTPASKPALLMERLGLQGSSTISRLIETTSSALGKETGTLRADWVRLAHVAAALNASIEYSFRFVARNDRLLAHSDIPLYDPNGNLDELLPGPYAERHLLHLDYDALPASCSRNDWNNWISGKGGVAAIPPLEQTESKLRKQTEFEERVARFQPITGLEYPYKRGYSSQRYILKDVDFPHEVLKHWESLPPQQVWPAVVEKLLLGPEEHWKEFTGLLAEQTSTSGGSRKPISGVTTATTWLRRLRESNCIRDQYGRLCKPSELLRRTPETEPLLDIESFVHERLDNERTRSLLDVLGVGKTIPDASRLIQRLETLRRMPKAPAEEAAKWYMRLDAFTESCSTLKMAAIARDFRTRRLCLSRDGDWLSPSEIYIESGHEDAPGMPLLPENVNTLQLWARLKVPRRPSADSAISWLMSLPAGQIQDDLTRRRIEAMLGRHPSRVWREVGFWLSMSGKWKPSAEFKYNIGPAQKGDFAHLHEWVREKVADFGMLDFPTASASPFADLTRLETAVEERNAAATSESATSPLIGWLNAFGECLLRIELDSAEATALARVAGLRFQAARIIKMDVVEVIPYLEGVPAGGPIRAPMAWIGTTVYATSLSPARLAGMLPEQLGRSLPDDALRKALCYCCDRSPEAVLQYMQENFTLSAAFREPGIQGGQDVDGDSVPAGDEDCPPPEMQSDAVPDLADTQPASTEGDSAIPWDPSAASIGSGSSGRQSPRQQNQFRAGQPEASTMAEFAGMMGFRERNGGFLHPDGRQLSRIQESSFPWELRNAEGATLRKFRPADVCFERQPLELTHEAWAALQSQPDRHSLIVISPDGRPVELTGRELLRRKESGVVKLHPATYRLRNCNA